MLQRWKTKTTRTTQGKPKCGFCGSTAHNRRNCNKLKNFVYVLNETNKAYRAAYYDRFIEGMGLGAGALITLRNMYRDDEQMAIMTSFPTEQIMFTNLKVSWSDYSTRAYADLLVGGAKARVDLANDTFYDDSGETDYADPWRGLAHSLGSDQMCYIACSKSTEQRVVPRTNPML